MVCIDHISFTKFAVFPVRPLMPFGTYTHSFTALTTCFSSSSVIFVLQGSVIILCHRSSAISSLLLGQARYGVCRCTGFQNERASISFYFNLPHISFAVPSSAPFGKTIPENQQEAPSVAGKKPIPFFCSSSNFFHSTFLPYALYQRSFPVSPSAPHLPQPEYLSYDS